MTNNQPNQPFEQFHVKSDLLKDQARPSGPGQRRDNSEPHWTAKAQLLAMPLLAVIYVVTQQRAEFRPLTVLVLLACLMFRMQNRDRQLVGVVLTLAAIKLAYQMSAQAFSVFGTQQVLQPQMRDALVAVPWLPMFFAACVLYMPREGTVTRRIIMVGAISMLASGLLPGDGYIAIFATIQYALFVAVGIGLAVDYSSRLHGNGSRRAVQAA